MPLWKRIRETFETKESASAALLHMVTLGRAVWTPRQYDKLAEEAYVKNVVAYRCVRMIAEGAANIPWILRQGERELSEHPILSLLNRPNPMQGGPELFESLYSYYLLAGNSYLEGVSLDDGLEELWILRPDRMSIKLGNKGYPQQYVYKVGQNEHVYDVDIGRGRQSPIMHLRSFHPTNDTYGMSPVEAGAFAIDVHNSAGAYTKALLDNQAKPSGALVYSGGADGRGTLTNEQFSRLQREMESKYTGVRNAGRPMLLEGGLDWKPMGFMPKDMEFSEGKRESAREVALAFGVPPMLLGIPGDNTFANYAEANRVFYRQTVLPLVGKVCRGLSNWMRPTYGDDYSIWYDIDEVQALATEREAVWDKIQNAEWLTTDEKREATGYKRYRPPADPEARPGEVILVSSARVPLEDMGLTMGGPEDDEDGETEDENTEAEPPAEPLREEDGEGDE